MPRKLIVLSVAAVLIVAACSDASSPTTTAAPTTSTSQRPTTTVPGTTATTVSPTTTSTTSSTTTSTTEDPTFTEQAAVYRVTDVADDDVLNVRSGPGVTNDIIATLEPVAEGVLTTGNGFVTPNGSTWVEITQREYIGWVNKRFLQRVDQTRAPFGQYPCTVGDFSVGTTPHLWLAPNGDSDADHVFDVEQIRGGACTRTVITLGINHSFSAPGDPADRVPADIVAEDRTSLVPHVIVHMPTIFRADTDATTRPGAFVARRTEGPTGEFGQHGLLANVPTGPGAHNVFYLANPARIVVDHWLMPEIGIAASWATGSGIVMIDPVVPAEGIPLVADGSQFSGYSRGFEASLAAQLIDTSTGNPVTVTWEPAHFGDPIISAFFVTTVNDWTEAWGQFGFTISGMDAGSYRLELSTDNASGSDEHEVLEFEFEVAG